MKTKTKDQAKKLEPDTHCESECEDGLGWEPQVRPYAALLQDCENNAQLNCGCIMHRCEDGTFHLYQCRTHDQAEALKEQAMRLRDLLGMGPIPSLTPKGRQRMIDENNAVLAKAEGV